jgi:hypothetical protein
MTKPFLLIVLLTSFFFSCKKSENTLARKSKGNINTISVIIEDQLWNGEIGESIRNKFATPIVGLLQEEPLFTINQYPAKLMEGFMTDGRTIIVVKKAAKTTFQHKKNQYASPQNVFHISGESNAAILDLIEFNSAQIIQIVKDGEIAEHQRLISQSLLNVQKLIRTFGVVLNVPTGYLYALEEKNFIWLKKEISSGSTSILIYQLPYGALKNDANSSANIIKIRDSISNLYIRGTELNTQMITDEGYAPYFSKITLNKKLAFETRGTWELNNDFMSGPFLNYVIFDKKRNRILILEGFCYSPAKATRDLMHELEAIIKSIRI